MLMLVLAFCWTCGTNGDDKILAWRTDTVTESPSQGTHSCRREQTKNVYNIDCQGEANYAGELLLYREPVGDKLGDFLLHPTAKFNREKHISLRQATPTILVALIYHRRGNDFSPSSSRELQEQPDPYSHTKEARVLAGLQGKVANEQAAAERERVAGRHPQLRPQPTTARLVAGDISASVWKGRDIASWAGSALVMHHPRHPLTAVPLHVTGFGCTGASWTCGRTLFSGAPARVAISARSSVLDHLTGGALRRTLIVPSQEAT